MVHLDHPSLPSGCHSWSCVVFIGMELTLTEQQMTGLDFASFKEAFEGKDLDRWLPFYAQEAEWIEYRHISPPRAPNRMVGKHQIADLLRRVCGADLEITIADEAITPYRVAFSVDCA